LNANSNAMNNSGTAEENAIEADDPERPPRYEQVVCRAEYVRDTPAAVWGPQQNAVVNGQIESARAADVSAEDRKRIREFADAELERSDDDGTG
jgi:hypothetical protein